MATVGRGGFERDGAAGNAVCEVDAHLGAGGTMATGEPSMLSRAIGALARIKRVLGSGSGAARALALGAVLSLAVLAGAPVTGAATLSLSACALP